MRKVILHYHLFKNAGTSIDQILKKSFPGVWQNWDRPQGKNPPIKPSDVVDFLDQNPHIIALSSHDIVPPLPQSDIVCFPILFLRHPVLRARSAYLFEWMKQPGLKQPKGTFQDYIIENIPRTGTSVIANFQVSKLSHITYGKDILRKQLEDHEKIDYSKLFLDSIPFFGLVEFFQESLIRMHYYLIKSFPQIRVSNLKANVLQETEFKLADKLELINKELGDETYNLLLEKNNLDMQLYNFAFQKFHSIAK